MTLIYTCIAAFGISTMALAGVLFTSTRGSRFLATYTHHILAFSVGVLCVTLWGIAHEALEHIEEAQTLSPTMTYLGSWGTFLLGGTVGALVLFVATRIHPHHHHSEPHDGSAAHTHAHDTGHTHTKIDGKHVLITDSVHNIADGVILFPAFLASPMLGIATMIGIMVHEFVEEVAEFFILKEAGYTTKEALGYSFVTAHTIFIGVALSFAASLTTFVLPWLFAVSFGSLLYLIVVDVLPCVFVHQKKWTDYVPLVACIICGALLMYGVSVAFPHA